MKIIYGLDLGVASIGWAAIRINDDNNYKILGMGSRIIPYSDKEGDEFGKGVGESVNQQRTKDRTARKGLDRYQLRRTLLNQELKNNNLLPDRSLFDLSALQLFGLRSKASTEKISLPELGRLLLHLNQRRGYKHGSEDEDADKKQRDWVETINSRYYQIKGKQTIGQFFFQELKDHQQNNKYYRIKEQIFPRDAYIEEFNTIWNRQQKEYPTQLSEVLKLKLRDHIIYYQRPLKSQKGLVSVCEFEGFLTKHNDGKTEKEIFVGPKVTPRSSPLFQISKIWESINAITIKRITADGKKHPTVDISPFKEKIFEHLNTNSILSEAELFQILGISKKDGYYSDKNVRKKGIQGNLTLAAILKALDGYDKKNQIIRFELKIESGNHLNKSTGEIISIEQVSATCEKEPLFQLWHTCYSLKEKEEKIRALKKRFYLPDEYARALAGIDFSAGSFSNKSAKAIRKILPGLMKGHAYSTAMEIVGYNHSFSETAQERANKVLQDKLFLLPKNALRQPIVEKILNQMINVVNSMMEEYPRPDEVRVELARELKQSKEERNDYFNAINQRTKQSEKIAERLQNEYQIKATRKNIEKWRLWHEVNGRCLYCNTPITVEQFLKGIESDVEHVIPKAVFFDDSFANKTIAHIRCNSAKRDMTAFDFMNTKGGETLNNYLQTINDLYKNDRADKAKTDEGSHCLTGKISKSKFDRLQWRKEDIPQDFVNRQLQESRYIARKAKQILNKVCVEVNSTSGNITETLRRLWGWGEILQNLALPRFRKQGLTEEITIGFNGNSITKEIIPGWSKRDDHRHHAIDALAVACTQQGFIQRLNTLNAEHTRNEMYAVVSGNNYSEKLTLLEKYLVSKRPFTTAQVQGIVEEILISYKAGKKVATLAKRKIKKNGKKEVVQEGIIVPRGALSEQSVYGKIKTLAKDFKKNETIKYPAKYLFENPQLIFKAKIKILVEERLSQHDGDVKKALASLKKQPIFLDSENKVELKFGTCFSEEAVIKYPITAITAKDVDYIIDEKVKELVRERLLQHNNKEKEAFKEVLWFDEEMQIPILSVRCFTGLKAVEPVKRDEMGKEIGFVLTKNNHHIALYKNEEGELIELPVTFWHAVERKSLFIHHFTREERDQAQENTIIKKPDLVWDKIESLSDNKFSESFLQKLPLPKWQFVSSIQRNEMFVIGLKEEELNDAIKANDYKLINQNLFRVNAIANKNYQFRLHTETKVDDKYNGVKNEMLSKTMGKLIIIQSIDAWKQRNPIKVRVNNLGKIVKVG
ncbi:type II CRISPR RNA-guided endonuclease Cas9 [Lacibacter sp. H375]|uniref:type II CRISPR RNA-guided endonuclease Cas9 n=1 Tax=Lacibacter sp. H375 TaxID=3133424 RepID=UPI0030C5CF44